jgi:hypothetical protein
LRPETRCESAQQAPKVYSHRPPFARSVAL